MACSEGFFRQDGPFSWVVMAVMVINSTMVGLLYTVIGVMTEKYPLLLNVEQSSANLVGAVKLGVFLGSGE